MTWVVAQQLFSLEYVRVCQKGRHRENPSYGLSLTVWGQSGSVGTDGFRVPPTRVRVTELARGRIGLLQGHTAGWNNSHSTGQTVNQNNFIVPEIGVECTAEIRRGRTGGGAAVGR